MHLFQRVWSGNLKGTIINLEKAKSGLYDMTWLTKNAGYSLAKVNKALELLASVISEDINDLPGLVTEIKSTYDQYVSPTIKLVLFCLEQVLLTFQTTAIKNQHADPIDQEHVMGDFRLLKYAIETLDDFYHKHCSKHCSEPNGLPFSTENINSEECTKYWCNHRPMVWQSSERDRSKCQGHLKTIQEKVYSTLSELSENPAGIVNEIISPLNHTVDCIREYKFSLQRALSALDKIKSDLEHNIDIHFNFDYENILATIINQELEYMNKNISWLNGLLLDYSRNDTTKVDLSTVLTPSTVVQLSHTMDSIISKLESNAFNPLRTTASLVEITSWESLHDGLATMNNLVPYFSANYIEDVCRRLQFWRHPTVELTSPNILRFQYSPGETWNTWSRSMSLQGLNRRLGNVARNILQPYNERVHMELHKIQNKFITAKKDVLSASNILVTGLQSFKETSNVDKNFIL